MGAPKQREPYGRVQIGVALPAELVNQVVDVATEKRITVREAYESLLRAGLASSGKPAKRVAR